MGNFGYRYIFIVILLSVVTGCTVNTQDDYTQECNTRATTTPDPPPIYPSAQLIDEDITDEEYIFRNTMHFTSEAPADDIVEFYRNALSGVCTDARNASPSHQTCHGDTEPFGVYNVRVFYDETEGTEFFVQVSMTKC